MKSRENILLWLLAVIGIVGCNLPAPPPDILYKFDVIQVGKGPSYLLTHDINLDGEPDLVSVNAKDNSLSLLYGKGDGTFHTPRNIRVASEPTMVTTGDINRDGIPDLVTNARGAEMVVILLGNGDGSFRRGVPIKTGKVPLNVILADFNNDKKLDAAVTLTFDQMEIYMGSGDGYFKKKETYLTGSRSFSGVAEDFNGDGNTDIALATSSSNASSIRVFLGNDDATFQKPIIYAKNLVPLALILEDMNADGKPDLVFASGKGDNLYMLFSKGDGSFSEPISFSGGGGPFSLTAGHFNQDKIKDVAVANSRSSSFSLVVRNDNGSFHYPTRDYVVDGGTVLAITSGDYNHSGMQDIAVASNFKNTIEIFLQRRSFN
jgi:hypothetical protein